MKTSISKLFLALALAAGCVTSVFGAAMPGATEGQAVVKVVTGTATFTDATGGTGTVRNEQVIRAGATINTGPGASVVLDLGDNGNALEIKPDTTLKIDTLIKKQVGSEKAITTELDLKKGSVVGNVKKLSKASTYEVKTANGVAGIRGTSFHIFAVGIFRCANGMLLVRVTEVTPGQPQKTVTVTVPAGREVVVPPPAATTTTPPPAGTPVQPAPTQPAGTTPPPAGTTPPPAGTTTQPTAQRPALRPVLIEREVVVAIVNNANVLAQIVQIPVVSLPPTGTRPPVQQVTEAESQRVDQAIQAAVTQLAQVGANNSGQQLTGNALAFETFLKNQANDLELSDANRAAKVAAGVAAYQQLRSGAVSEQQAAIVGQVVFNHFVNGSTTAQRDALITAEIRDHKGFTPAQSLNLSQIAAERAFAVRVAHDIIDRISPTDPRLNVLIDAAARTFIAARNQGLDQNTCYAAAKAVYDNLSAHPNASLSSQLVSQAIQGQRDNAVAGNQLPGINRLMPGNLPSNLNDIPVSPIAGGGLSGTN